MAGIEDDYDDDTSDELDADVPEAEAPRERVTGWLKDQWAGVPALGGLPAWFAAAASRRSVRVGVVGVGVLVLLGTTVVPVREGQVAVRVDNLTGSMTALTRPGFYIVVPGISSSWILDRRVKTLVMSEAGGGGFDGGNAIGIKTLDGSNVSLDVQVSYRIIPDLAADALRLAGPGNAAGDLWIRSSVRAAAAAEFGKLTTEQIYDANALSTRSIAAVEASNKKLGPRGLEIVAIAVQGFKFFQEYEEVIRQKKLADQEVEEQQAKARLAAEEQSKKVAAARFQGDLDRTAATGEADRVRAAADAYDQRVRLEGDSTRMAREKQAAAVMATGMAEAEAMQKTASAMGGGGGTNLVALEYAKKMVDIQFTGVPILEEAHTSRYRIDSAAAVGGKK